MTISRSSAAATMMTPPSAALITFGAHADGIPGCRSPASPPMPGEAHSPWWYFRHGETVPDRAAAITSPSGARAVDRPVTARFPATSKDASEK